ncbi:unnamed protein product [Orchesella dallaii]|uniref:F-box domain-containing protein n=1 Tax=Orchesella dallaii TaxID=48710 RepID=A0ABP1S026_9HEXA
MAANLLNEDGQNPFLNPLIVKNIFSFMPFDTADFANVRLVCKLWCEESLSIWRKNAVISVTDGNEKKRKVKAITNSNYLQLCDSENDEYQLNKYPFRNFAITNCVISLDKRDDPDFLKFWQEIGPTMTTLLIQDSGFYQVEAFRQIILRLTPNLVSLTLRNNSHRYGDDESIDDIFDPRIPEFPQKNLVYLEIEFDVDGETERWMPLRKSDVSKWWYCDVFQISWTELFCQFPMIQEIKLVSTPLFDELLPNILETIQDIREEVDDPQYLSCLKKLDIQDAVLCPEEFEFIPKYVTLFHKVKLPLTKFSFEIGSRTGIKTFKRLLEVHAGTLEELAVSRVYPRLPVRSFPFGVTFGALTKFEVVGNWLANLNFLSYMPNLKTVSLCSGRDEIFDPRKLRGERKLDYKSVLQIVGNTKLEELSNSGVVVPSLEKFINVEEVCDGSQIELLSKLMPNLKHFRAGLGTEGFRMVCKVWKKMEHLEIRPFQVDEMGLLGTGMVNGEKYYYHHPNLTDLTELKSFRIGYVDLRKANIKYNLTNASIMNGVLELNNLQNIDACLSKKITREVRAQLLDKFPQGDNKLFVI